ncbi:MULTISPECIES: GGDEF and EAL domain-containing protein [unclassified Vibrio]|uniref:EAL domain-containing protein n=1 Tax=Vibrio sp. HB236076 TaxID=3232307 RepID=A0AB39HJ03_9VIBR|nr:GGDEF and EAL domain-containing protein [Vibrio sp. HB161653]MDP5252988.1 GGDEF and EAL domain-containing protein [Vibrio sp. HB161653]
MCNQIKWGQSLSLTATTYQDWQNLIEMIATFTGADSVVISPIGDKAIPLKVEHNKRRIEQAFCFTLLCQSIVESQKSLLIEDLPHSEEFQHLYQARSQIKSVLGYPLLWPDGHVFGSLVLLFSERHPFSASEIALVEHSVRTLQMELKLLWHSHSLKLEPSGLEKSGLEQSGPDQIKPEDQKAENLLTPSSQMVKTQPRSDFYQYHDNATQLLNRSGLLNALSKMSIKHAYLSILSIGIANAASLQSKFGVDALDAAIVLFNQRIQSLVPSNSLIARTATSELTLVILDKTLHDNIETLCRQIQQTTYHGFHFSDFDIQFNTFIGIAQQIGDDYPKALLLKANQAMLLCKDSGYSHQFYHPEHTESLKQHNQLESFLLQAVRNDDLMLYYQAKVCAKTGAWIGAEALLRWKHPILGIISDEALITMAENNGLIYSVGAFALRSAIETAKAWSAYVESFSIAVNVSALQLRRPDFSQQVEHWLKSYQLPAKYIQIEVTESSVLTQDATTADNIKALHNLGLALAVDDFGTGFASFSYLKRYPFQAIKIDKSFINHIEHSHHDRAIVKSIIGVAKQMKLQIIIEGIESQSQADYLNTLGYDIAQGFIHSKPMPAKKFGQALRLHQPSPPSSADRQ